MEPRCGLESRAAWRVFESRAHVADAPLVGDASTTVGAVIAACHIWGGGAARLARADGGAVEAEGALAVAALKGGRGG
eukprot:5573025-Prymnesium_polylepis.1